MLPLSRNPTGMVGLVDYATGAGASEGAGATGASTGTSGTGVVTSSIGMCALCSGKDDYLLTLAPLH
jgi:hypothetical protein